MWSGHGLISPKCVNGVNLCAWPPNFVGEFPRTQCVPVPTLEPVQDFKKVNIVQTFASKTRDPGGVLEVVVRFKPYWWTRCISKWMPCSSLWTWREQRESGRNFGKMQLCPRRATEPLFLPLQSAGRPKCNEPTHLFLAPRGPEGKGPAVCSHARVPMLTRAKCTRLLREALTVSDAYELLPPTCMKSCAIILQCRFLVCENLPCNESNSESVSEKLFYK